MILLYFREKRTTSGYFTVDPVLRVNKKETIPLECVSLQTVLSKSLGPLSEWSDRLRVSVLYTCNTAAIYYFNLENSPKKIHMLSG